jgi:hypothetical protein
VPDHLQVAHGIYVAGEAVAKSREILAQHGITHVVNCVGALYPEYFKQDGIGYTTLWLSGKCWIMAAMNSICSIPISQNTACTVQHGPRHP